MGFDPLHNGRAANYKLKDKPAQREGERGEGEGEERERERAGAGVCVCLCLCVCVCVLKVNVCWGGVQFVVAAYMIADGSSLVIECFIA